jgi:hypothetical protein
MSGSGVRGIVSRDRVFGMVLVCCCVIARSGAFSGLLRLGPVVVQAFVFLVVLLYCVFWFCYVPGVLLFIPCCLGFSLVSDWCCSFRFLEPFYMLVSLLWWIILPHHQILLVFR